MKDLTLKGVGLISTIFIVLAFGYSQFAYSATIKLAVGHTELIKAAGVERVALGDGSLAEIEVLKDSAEVLLIGLAPGQTDLRIWSQDGRVGYHKVHISGRQPVAQQSQIQHLAQRIAGIEITDVDGHLLLTGQPESPQAAGRLAALTAAHPQVGDFTDPVDLAPTPTVQVQARFVELRKSALHQIGINWNTRSPGINFAYASDLETNDFFRGDFGDQLPAESLPLDIGPANRYLGAGLNLSAIIDFLDESGEAQVIAEPMLSTLSGSSAEFQAGGEVPIPVQDGDGNTDVTFKDYGILLKVAPQVADSGLIRTQIEVEVSDIDESVSVMGVPGFSVRNAITEMNGPSGKTLLIAGLIDEKQSEAVSQFPGLGELPIIGKLFSSRRFQNEETELVVLITPQITPAASINQLTHTTEQNSQSITPALPMPKNPEPLPLLPLEGAAE